MKKSFWRKSPYFILVIPAVLQLLVSASFGLGVDEAHYMLYGRYLDLSYFDHPPLVGWVHFAFNFLFGENEFAARLPAVLLGFATACTLYRILENRLPEKTTVNLSNAFLSLVTVTLAQIFILNLFLLPETFLLLWATLLVLACDRVRRIRTFDLYAGLTFGGVLGLAALSKFTAILFVPAVAIFLIRELRWQIFKNIHFYLMVLIAALGVLPVVIWNHNHDWISFKYQAGHVLSGNDSFKSFLQSWIMQLAFITPWFWLVSVWGFALLLRDPREIFLKALLAVFAVFFIFASFRGTVLPHWAAVFYLFAFLFGARAAFAKFSRTFRFFAGLQISIFILVTILFITGLVGRFAPDALREIDGWPQIAATVERDLVLTPGSAWGVFNWTYGSRALFYGGKLGIPVLDFFVLDDRVDQFDIWNPTSPRGRDIYILSFSYDELNPAKFTCAGGWGDDQRIPIERNGRPIYTAVLSLCRGFQ